MARAALDWTVENLSVAAGVGTTTIVRFEREQTTASKSTVASIERAFAAAGVSFLNGGEPGVRLLLHISMPIESGRDYIFNSMYKGHAFKVIVNKTFLNDFDFSQDPRQPKGKYLLRRLALRVLPFVMRAWDAGRRPVAGTMRLIEADFPAARAQDTEKRLRIRDLPTHRTPWDGSISLRREDIYGDDGR